MAGLILKEEYFAFSKRDEESDLTIHRDARRIIDGIALSWIGPIFFIVWGTRLVIDMDILLVVVDKTIAFVVSLFKGTNPLGLSRRTLYRKFQLGGKLADWIRYVWPSGTCLRGYGYCLHPAPDY